MLLAGVDVSGRPGIGNYKFMSIVIGTDEKIESMMRQVGMDNIHMNTIHDEKIHDHIISQLRFDNKQCTAFCYRIELDTAIKNTRSGRSRNVRKSRIFATCYYVMWMHMQDQIKSFLQSLQCDIHDVAFQCDSDSEMFLKTAGLRRTHKGQAHSLSDVVAWANNNGKEPYGVVSQDLSEPIERQVKSMIK